MEKKLAKKIEKITGQISNDLIGMGLVDEKDFYIFSVEEGNLRKKETNHYLKIHFRLKGNKKVIELLESKGWVKDKRYANGDGNPSIWASDLHGKEYESTVVMVRMQHLVNLNIEKLKAVKVKAKL